MAVTNPCIVVSMNALAFKTMDAITNVSTPKKDSDVNVTKDTNSWLMAKLAKTSMNVLRSPELAPSTVLTPLALTAANVTPISMSVKATARLASESITSSPGSFSATDSTFET
jgi:hypothetical protein